MKIKRKLCVGCNREQFIWKSEGKYKYCKRCWLTKVPAEYKPLNKKYTTQSKKPIRLKSSKMTALDTVYTAMRKVYLTKYPMCNARLMGCSLSSTDIHHKKGRGKYQNDPTTWLSVCRNCHDWIEENPIEAKELNYSNKKQ